MEKRELPFLVILALPVLIVVVSFFLLQLVRLTVIAESRAHGLSAYTAVITTLAVLSTADFRSLEEGAASFGTGFWRRFFDIVIPNCRSGIVAGALMVVTLSVREFNITWMLHTPENKTLPVGLADSYASMRLEVGSAYTIVFLIMIIPLLIALQCYGQPRKKLLKVTAGLDEAGMIK